MVPVFDQAQGKGRTLLVTAGVDGDEYAGIEAAFQLIKKYKKTRFAGRLIIVPILNVPGYLNSTSMNPLDNKFPKYMGIGNKHGSSSQRLMYWLTHTYGVHADVWIDLHGGATDELLVPFAASWETGKKDIDARVVSIQSSLAIGMATREPARYMGSAKYLASYGCAYLLTESGQLGERKKSDIDRHITWVETAMSMLAMIKKKLIKQNKAMWYGHIGEYGPFFDGIWYPSYDRPRQFSYRELFGTVVSLDGKRKQEITAKHNGHLLWGKIQAPVKKGDILLGFGY